nr:ABC transporter ATP-binding protein [uncultured Cohaesibacter sp.]
MTIEPGTLLMKSVTYQVGDAKLVNNVSLEVSAGEIVGILGPNGAGKSSLLGTIYHLNRPSKGTIKVNGKDVWQQTTEWAAQNIGAVLQDMPTDFPLTTRDIIAMGRSAHKRLLSHDTPHDHMLIDSAIELLNLGALEDRSFSTLSGGERQRALLARTLVQQPRILVLDEPTNHLDIHHQLQLLQLVKALKTTVIAALHDLNLAANFCDRLCILNKGQLVASGAPETVLTKELLREIYRIDATIDRHPATGQLWIFPY